MKTYTQLINELKDSTLASYIKKAPSEFGQYMHPDDGGINHPYAKRKRKNRTKGFIKAVDRLTKGKTDNPGSKKNPLKIDPLE